MKILSTVMLSLSLAGLANVAVAYDCAYAEQDIQRLQNEKQTTLDRAAEGVSAILPLGAAFHMLEGDEGQALNEVSTDDYNRALDRQIAQIKAVCNLP